MNIFRSLIGKVWQDPNAEEVVKIASGRLFLTRTEILRSKRSCIYNEAMATIRRIPSLEHNFQLVITKVYEDEDQELLEDEDETEEERVFLIGEELEFRLGETDGEPTLIWRDLQGDVDEFYEFVCPDTNAPTRAFFETCMYRAMYERKYKRSADSAPESALDEFVYKPKAKESVSKPKQKAAPSKASSTKVKPEPEPEPVEEKQRTPQPRESLGLTPVTLPSATSVLTQEINLYRWNFDAEEFENQGIANAQILKSNAPGFHYYLAVTMSGGPLLCHPLSSDMNPRYSKKMQTITWNNVDAAGNPSSWVLLFPTLEDYQSFQATFMSSLWESLHQTSWAKIKGDEQDYVMRSANDEDVEMRDVGDESDDDEEVQAALDPDEEPSDDEEEEPQSEDDDDIQRPAEIKGDRNSQLTVGYKGDRSYVVRGNNIGVFSHNKGSVKYYATISKLATPKGKEFKPAHVMLHDQDTKMILMNDKDPNSLFSLDIERGKVVEEWKVHDDIPVLNIAPENKFAPTTREQTIVGTSGNALFRIDPRISGQKLVDSQYKQYASKNQFSGVVTTAAGKLAVASEKGDIRLFDSIGKNAKTALPALGDPILGIDVTADGRWIVATTKTYLLLIDTLIGEGRYAGSLGFDRSFPATAKPMPKRLQLKPEHVAYMGNNISFTPARFNQGEGQTENTIVTSTGQFVIAWDFAKVKKGFNDKYEIKKYEDHVVQDNFKFGDDKEIIVALDNNVLAINKKNLKRPTRQSLASPVGGSHSGIVNSPY